jgi:uncharacterized protein YjbI with pentapeptide repeats
MADKSNLQARMDSLEKKLSETTRFGRLSRFWSFLGFLLVCGLLSANLWMISRQLEKLSTSDKEHAFWVVCHSESTTEREKAFLKLVELKNTEWLSARLNDLKLNGVNLRGVDLKWTFFNDTDLSEANFADAKLYKSEFQRANLSDSNLSGIEANEAVFFKANLSGSNLRGANLRSAKLDQANARNAQLVMASLADGNLRMIDLTNADLTGADFTGADLESAILKGANLALARLSYAILIDVDLTDSNWWRARGLTTTQIEHFKNVFSPTQNAGSSRRQDYELWLKSTEKIPALSP